MRGGLALVGAAYMRTQLPHLDGRFRTAVLAGVIALQALLAAPATLAAQKTVNDGRYHIIPSSAGGIRMEVLAVTPLSQLLSALCEQQSVECAGEKRFSAQRVPRMVIEGTFLEVVARLVEGEDANLEFAHGTSERASQLVFLSASPSAEFEAPGSGVRTADAALLPAQTQPPLIVPMIELADGTQVEEPAAGTNILAGSQSAPPLTEPGQAHRAAEMIYAGGGIATTTPTGLPFPDQYGRPMPVATPDQAVPSYLPFPDQFGNPIPVRPAQPGSPFPMTSAAKAD